MIFPPSAGALSKATFSDKSGDGLAGGHAARQALVVSCRVPVGSACDRAWEVHPGALPPTSPSILQGSASLVTLRWQTELHLQKSVTKWVICIYFPSVKSTFFGRESISWAWEGITMSSLNYLFSCFPCNKRMFFTCKRNILSSQQPCEPPPKHQNCLKFYSAAAAGNFLALHVGTPTPSALALTTTCHYPSPERQVTDWLVLAGDSRSEPGQAWLEVPSQAVQGRDPKQWKTFSGNFMNSFRRKLRLI